MITMTMIKAKAPRMGRTISNTLESSVLLGIGSRTAGVVGGGVVGAMVVGFVVGVVVGVVTSVVVVVVVVVGVVVGSGVVVGGTITSRVNVKLPDV